MSYLQQQLFHFQEKMRSINAIEWPASPKQPLAAIPKEKTSVVIARKINRSRKQLVHFHRSVKLIGASATMDDYEKRKLGIFNQLNFFQLITGICIPVVGLLHNNKFPEWAWLVASLPAVISLLVLVLNANRKYDAGIIFYFICYPVVTSIVYMSGINVGVELFFILYGILSVFFCSRLVTCFFRCL